jgi:DNA-binding response OmpR family regulator
MRVLLIEDDVRVASFIKRGLEAERYDVQVAIDGEQAMQMADDAYYDVIVLDLLLPKASGIEVCRHIRGSGNSTPILMLTARDSLADKVAGLAAGADDYMTKPFAFEELLVRIQVLLRRGRDLEMVKMLQVGDLELDIETHEVRRAGRVLDLTPKEFALLEYLMQRAGRVVSRTLIEERVWGYRHDPMTNVVNVYIRRLRRKIEQPSEPPLIRTVRGVGYALKAG